MSEQHACPCGSGKTFAACCGPYLSGERTAPTAEALMRSRYTAYTRHDDAYLLATWHADTRPAEANPSADDGSRWTGLTILRTVGGGEVDAEGVVEFIASCDIHGTRGQLHEISRFRRIDGRWLYWDGDPQQPQSRERPKVGRNAPCPCGSGRKYKKCCAGKQIGH